MSHPASICAALSSNGLSVFIQGFKVVTPSRRSMWIPSIAVLSSLTSGGWNALSAGPPKLSTWSAGSNNGFERWPEVRSLDVRVSLTGRVVSLEGLPKSGCPTPTWDRGERRSTVLSARELALQVLGEMMGAAQGTGLRLLSEFDSGTAAGGALWISERVSSITLEMT
jgi:hypothetical protein